MKTRTWEETAQIELAISTWEKAWSTTDTPEMQTACQMAAQALRLELKTGIVHCSRHLKPVGDDGRRNSR
jgi:hypothetical protein